MVNYVMQKTPYSEPTWHLRSLELAVNVADAKERRRAQENLGRVYIALTERRRKGLRMRRVQSLGIKEELLDAYYSQGQILIKNLGNLVMPKNLTYTL